MCRPDGCRRFLHQSLQLFLFVTRGTNCSQAEEAASAISWGKRKKKKKMELSVTAAMCISWRRGAAEHRGAAAVIRNTLLEAGADSSEQLFLPFTTFMGEFCLPEHFKWRKKYSWSPLVFSCFRSKVDLIIRFLWPGYQWTSQQRPYLMRRLT